MKKSVLKRGMVLILGVCLITGCSLMGKSGDKDSKKLIVGASPAPHAEILNKAKEILSTKGYELEIKEFTDYVQPNMALNSGDLDANYFQHQPYLDQFNKENNTDLISAGAIHYEPFGIYPGKTKTLTQLKEGAQIAVPNDGSNEARALFLLEAQGLITLKADAGTDATIQDIESNPMKYEILEIAAEQLPRSLEDVDVAVINGNYALAAGLNVATDAIAVEDTESVGATTYGNIVAVKKGDETRESIKALVEVLQSEEVSKFIDEKYAGAVVVLK